MTQQGCAFEMEEVMEVEVHVTKPQTIALLVLKKHLVD